MKIPPATSSGRTFRLPGYGMPRLKGGGFGDELVSVKIVMPAELTRRREGALRKIRRRSAASHLAAATRKGRATMRLDKFTVKAQEAIQAAQSLADQHEHQAVEPEHVLAALLQQREGVVGPILGKLGVRLDDPVEPARGRAGADAQGARRGRPVPR